ncbi:MAG: hypothetical protein GIW99_05235 [Candidatus Eremiobacteraeota bacterium]|nr:hypothetical protein [Candidatus Eremiobacteraeota bacterium]
MSLKSKASALRRFAATTVLGCAATLAACGGGGGGATVPAPGPSPSPTPIQLTAGMVLGQSAFPEGDTSSGGHGNVIDGIACAAAVGGYHIHSHISLFRNGTQIALPLAIGIPNPQIQNGFVTNGSCFYQLHAHDASGIVHVEAQRPSAFTVGQFFDIWGEQLSSSNVAGFSGPVVVYVNGTQYGGDPRAIVFAERQEVTLEVGSPTVAPPRYIFPSNY